MKTSFRMAAILALVMAGQVLAASTVAYTLQLGGDPHRASYKAGFSPAYSGSSGSDVTSPITAGTPVSWAVVATVAGTHSGGTFNGLEPAGIANTVFTLELKDSATSTIQLGHVTYTDPTVPSTAGWYSIINDGTARTGFPADPVQSAAYCENAFGIGANNGRLFDNAASGGPYMDFYHYPSCIGLPTNATNCAGKLIGMGAGYKTFNPTAHGGPNTGGVGLTGNFCPGLGVFPLFEGQISTVGFANGTYTLTVTGGTGTNILPDDSAGDICEFGPTGAFAVAPNVLTGDTITFVIGNPCTALALSSAVSQKTHGTAGTYNTNSGAIEGRSGGPTRIVATFNQNVHRVNNTAADFTLSSGTLGTVTVAGAVVTANVSGVTDSAIFTIGFPGIASDCNNATVATTKCWKVLQGDAQGASPVNAFDILAIRGVIGQTASSTNYTKDVNASGKVDAFDVLFCRGKLGHAVAGVCNP